MYCSSDNTTPRSHALNSTRGSLKLSSVAEFVDRASDDQGWVGLQMVESQAMCPVLVGNRRRGDAQLSNLQDEKKGRQALRAAEGFGKGNVCG